MRIFMQVNWSGEAAKSYVEGLKGRKISQSILHSTSLNNHNYSQRVNFSFPIPSSGSNDNPDNEGQGKKSE